MKLNKVALRTPVEITKKKVYKKSLLSRDSSEKLCLRSDLFGLRAFADSSELAVEVGDLVQIDRVLYTEWALYIGNGNVVHLCGLDCENEISTDDFATVKLSRLAAVAGTSGVRVNNKIVGAKDRNLESLPAEKVVQNGMELVGKVVKFNLLTKNSEHYVTDWKYGHGWSDQALVTMNVMRALSSEDSSVGHSVLVNSLNAVLNSPASPISRSPPTFSNLRTSNEKSCK